MTHLPRPARSAPARPETPNTHGPNTKLRGAVPVLILSFLALVCAPAFAQTANLSTTSLVFNTQIAGTTSGAKTVKVTTTGAARLTFSSTVASGDFAIQATSTSCGATLAANKNCNIG